MDNHLIGGPLGCFHQHRIDGRAFCRFGAEEQFHGSFSSAGALVVEFHHAKVGVGSGWRQCCGVNKRVGTFGFHGVDAGGFIVFASHFFVRGIYIESKLKWATFRSAECGGVVFIVSSIDSGHGIPVAGLLVGRQCERHIGGTAVVGIIYKINKILAVDTALRTFSFGNSHIGGHCIDGKAAQFVGADSIPVEGVIYVG